MTNMRKKIKRQFAGYALKKRKFMLFYFLYAHFATMCVQSLLAREIEPCPLCNILVYVDTSNLPDCFKEK